MKSELESLSLQVLQPHVYESINAELERLVRAQAPLFEIVREQILECLTENNLPVVDVRMSPENIYTCLLYTSPSPRDRTRSRMPSSA